MGEKIKLTVEEMFQVNQGLDLLSGYERPASERGEQRVIFEPSKLGPAVRSRIAFNRRHLRPYIEAQQEALQGLEQEWAAKEREDPMPDKSKPDEVQRKDNAGKTWNDRRIERAKEKEKQRKELMKATEELELRVLQFADLQLDKNENITPAVLELIYPIVLGIPD